MKRTHIAFASILAGLVFSGCQSMVQSTRETDHYPTATEEKGQYYYLPKSLVKVTGVWDSTFGTWDLTATPMFGADTNDGVFMLSRHAIYVTDDTVTFATDPTSGLLQTVNGTSTDQTVNSVASLAAAAASFTGLPTAIGNLVNSANQIAKVTELKKQIHLEFLKQNGHPDISESELVELTNRMNKASFLETSGNARFPAFQTYLDPAMMEGTNKYVYVMSPMVNNQVTYGQFELKLAKLFDTNTTKRGQFPDASNHPWLNKTGIRFNGVLVRDPIPYQLIVTGRLWFTHFTTNSTSVQYPFLAGAGNPGAGQNNQATPMQTAWTYNLPELTNCFTLDFPSNTFTPRTFLAMQQTFTLADVNHTRVVDIARTPLVQDTTSLTLANGMVQSRQYTRPSIVMGILGVPKTLLTAIVPLPGGGGGNGSSGNSGNNGNNAGGSGQNAQNSSSQANAQNTSSQASPSNTAQFAPIQ
jgi:hypothetical protein